MNNPKKYLWIYCDLDGKGNEWRLAIESSETLFFPVEFIYEASSDYEASEQYEIEPPPIPLPKTTLNLKTRSDLKRLHGTPDEFETALRKAVTSGMISVDEAKKSSEKYRKEWMDAHN